MAEFTIEFYEEDLREAYFAPVLSRATLTADHYERIAGVVLNHYMENEYLPALGVIASVYIGENYNPSDAQSMMLDIGNEFAKTQHEGVRDGGYFSVAVRRLAILKALESYNAPGWMLGIYLTEADLEDIALSLEADYMENHWMNDTWRVAVLDALDEYGRGTKSAYRAGDESIRKLLDFLIEEVNKDKNSAMVGLPAVRQSASLLGKFAHGSSAELREIGEKLSARGYRSGDQLIEALQQIEDAYVEAREALNQLSDLRFTLDRDYDNFLDS